MALELMRVQLFVIKRAGVFYDVHGCALLNLNIFDQDAAFRVSLVRFAL